MSRDWEDYVQVIDISEEIRRSRKERRCNWCHTVIRKGERYRRFVVKVDGQMGADIGCIDAPHCHY